MNTWSAAKLADTGLGFILWGILAAAAGYGFGYLATRYRKYRTALRD